MGRRWFEAPCDGRPWRIGLAHAGSGRALPRLQVGGQHCGCCAGWVDHMRATGFPIEDNVVRSVATARRRLGTNPICPAMRLVGAMRLRSCSRAAVTICWRAPRRISGLAVPGMPGLCGHESLARRRTATFWPSMRVATCRWISFESNQGHWHMTRLAPSAILQPATVSATGLAIAPGTAPQPQWHSGMMARCPAYSSTCSRCSNG